MTVGDLAGLTLEGVRAHRLRYALSALAVGVGVAAVVLLASIGEGMRRYIEGQLTQFGSTIIGVNPGKVETGGVPGMMGGSERKLTLDDARALARLPGAASVVPVAMGTAVVEYRGRSRSVYVYGASREMDVAWSWPVAVGEPFPNADWDRGSPVALLGRKARVELFRDENPLGAAIRVGESRFRVTGVMESKGQFLGFDMDDAVFIPVANALRLFNLTELHEIDVLASSPEDIDPLAARIKDVLRQRHQGREDFTITTQAEAMVVVNRILGIVTGVVTAIAGISLLVGAIGILTILWIVVRERTAEIGLAKALGAKASQIRAWYLFEAAATSAAGGGIGLAVGLLLSRLLAAVVPGLSTATPAGIVLAALGMAIAVGLAAGVAPAMRAAALDPIEALRAE
ncbi:MAG TPA: ABC transporter permease [Candidatus Eisenbacteria bacterium]